MKAGMGMGMEIDDDRGDALAQLRAELAAVEPSPGFAARVRGTIAARRGPRVALWLAAAALAGLVTMASLAIPIQPEGGQRGPAASLSDLTLPVPMSPAEDLPAAGPRRAPVRSPARQAAATALPTESTFKVLVPPDQAIAVRRLLLMHGAGRRFAVASDGHAVDEVTGTLLEPVPVEIPRITIELLPGSEPGMGGKVK
jgi:hypothetical protein